MRRDSAITLVKDTLEQPFDKERFARFAKELLNRVEDAPFVYKGNLVFDDFRDHVDSLERIGKYQDAEENKLDILIVRLKRASSVERARTAQRQFVAKYLKGSRGGELKDAALVAFVSPDEDDWRFSFVRMEYKIGETEKGRIRVKEEFTPARRYSFLVGKNENSHTAQSRLLPILEDSERNPSLTDIEDAFSVEKVTKEFFEKYRELYLEINEALDAVVKKDKAVRSDFAEKGIETADFAKKLLGQIVFLYFLQKKGWFGVARNAAWGSGPKNFLRRLCSGDIVKYDNFFNDVLEPLFYEALATERPADWYNEFKCKIPFLNGGLFDPLNDYDWIHTDVLLPNDIFTNRQKTKQGDIGTGILDVFDRYNFTVKEDEPLEKEVAVDPEMLGKVFENLLEVKDRKSKGTYYTPREIVHYMCQESLVNYLATDLEADVSRDDVVTLVKHGESALENDVRVKQEGRETDRYYFKLPDSIRDHAKVLDDKLTDIKVCDPAVGSGAFLVGMMSEILRCRQVLTEFIGNADRRSAYDLKRHAIQNSLHGVDIDPSAVEIAKLRLWLSLVVDEENYKQIQPLPNLDYKIMQGNSLLETYEGIELIDRQFLVKQDDKDIERNRLNGRLIARQREYIDLHQNGKLTSTDRERLDREIKGMKDAIAELDHSPSAQRALQMDGKAEPQAKAERLLKLHRDFFAAYHKREKERLHREIESLTWDLIETTLKQHKKSKALDDLKKFQRTNTRPFFLWRLYFADVFLRGAGFDIIIANPPYGAVLTAVERLELDARFSARASATKNSAIYFVYLSETLLAPRGTNTFIVPKSLVYSAGWRPCAQSIVRGLYKLIDTGKAFESVRLEQVIFIRALDGSHATYVNGVFDGQRVLEEAEVSKDTFDRYRVLLCGQRLGEIRIINKVMDRAADSLGQYVSVERGLNWQRIAQEAPGTTPIFRGAQIRPYAIAPPTDFVDLASFPHEEYEYQLRPKILNQLAIAHVQNPYPHFYLQAALDTQNRLVYETVSCTFAKNSDTDLRVVLAYNNSRIFAWLLYKLIYSTAIRSTRYDELYLSRMPWPYLNADTRRELIALVGTIVRIAGVQGNNGRELRRSAASQSLDRIDELFYDAFSLSTTESSVIEGHSRITMGLQTFEEKATDDSQ